MHNGKTAGELSLQASGDNTPYDALDVAEAMTKDILEQVWICIDKHYNVIDEPEFCVVLLRASDPLIHNVVRKKFYGYPYLPQPRPEQTVFHYDKRKDDICRLWSLPNPKVMAIVSEMQSVAPRWELTKIWCDLFYHGLATNNHNFFYEFIRKQHGITLQSEKEFLYANREKLIKAGCKDVGPVAPDPFDFSKISVNKIVNTNTVSA